MFRSKSWFRTFYSATQYQNIWNVKATLIQQSCFFFLFLTAVRRAIKDSLRVIIEIQASAYRLLDAGKDKQQAVAACKGR